MSGPVDDIIFGWIVGGLIYGSIRREWGLMLHTIVTGIGAILMTAMILGAFK